MAALKYPTEYIGYKLFRKRKDGTYGPLFINRKQKLVPGVVYEAEDKPTKGYAHRPGWHVMQWPHAPHLSNKGRVWCKVRLTGKWTAYPRPGTQGGIWILGSHLEIVEEML